ncbi:MULTISPECIES: GNAT family N-acetyltransferase [Bacillaceae]|uniref:GNAT family N-acetyltransferase n=1 Tax=Evansella alkalicola TaxID=745819 RepID=A0ABS6JWE7_9BACI|nr:MULTISPECIES: GNAT family N-acetyltransferase [Bacillaceae]MBU9722908.1 GNAT family N-acetyltransferase [Bacillus alkalicola]
MKIRKLVKEELDYSFSMSEFAFQYELSGEDREKRKKWAKPENTWVIEEDNNIISKATILPLETYILGKKVPMGGVSGVVTWPEHRRSGNVKKLLAHCLETMKDNGQIVSFLYPFSIPFYRKMGWELFADQQTITLTRDQLPPRKDTTGYIKRVDQNHHYIDEVYQAWAKQFNGTLARDENWWNQSIFTRKKGNIGVYYNSTHEARGYIIYSIKSNLMKVHELIYLDPEARDGLWTFISNHDSMLEKLEIIVPPNSGLPFILHDPKVKREIKSYFMARIVDVEKFLTLFSFVDEKDKSTIILHITDDFCKWNDGTYFIHPVNTTETEAKIEFYPSKSVGSCQHPPKKGIRLSVQTLTALLLNSQSMDTLLQEDFVLGDHNTAKRLSNSFQKQQPFIHDFF